MPRFDRADLIARCNLIAGRPAADGDMTPAKWDTLLSDAQDHWVRTMATHVPAAMYGTPIELAPTEGGAEYRFPEGVEIVGRLELRNGRWGSELGRSDFILERDRVRFPYGVARSFRGGLWARYVAAPAEGIGPRADGSIAEPVLEPPSARVLLCFRACSMWAERGAVRDSSPYHDMETRAWNGDPQRPGDVGILDALKMQYGAGDAELEEMGGGAWYRGPDFR